MLSASREAPLSQTVIAVVEAPGEPVPVATTIGGLGAVLQLIARRRRDDDRADERARAESVDEPAAARRAKRGGGASGVVALQEAAMTPAHDGRRVATVGVPTSARRSRGGRGYSWPRSWASTTIR